MLHAAVGCTLKPLSRTNSVVEPEFAWEVIPGKSHHLRLGGGKHIARILLQSLPVFPQLHSLYISNMALYRPIAPYL